MPICPLDNTQLTRFSDGSELEMWDCPLHGGRYMSGTWTLTPIQKAVVSNTLLFSGSSAIGQLIENSAGNLIYYRVDSSTPNRIMAADDLESHIPLVELASAQVIGEGAGGDLKYLELNVTGLSAGDHNLTDTDWGESKVWIEYVSIEVASGTPTDFDIGIYEKDTFLAADLRYAVETLDATGWSDDSQWTYIDDDSSNEIHLRITENTGAGTYDVQIRGFRLA